MGFLSSVTPLQWSLVIGGIVAVLGIWKGQDVWTWAMTRKAAAVPRVSASVSPIVDDDVLDMLAMKRLTARNVRLGCKEGSDAMLVVASHFFHGTTGV